MFYMIKRNKAWWKETKIFKPKTQIWILILPLTNYLILDKFPDIFKPLFPC